MLIIDAHLDLAMNALQWNRDLLASVYTIRVQEKDTPGKGRGLGTVAFPQMREGRIALSFATVIARSTGQPSPLLDFATPEQAHGTARGQLAYYHALERREHIRLIGDVPSLDAHMAEWKAWENRADAGAWVPTPPLGFVISMEGADPIVEPAELEDWWRQGLRIIGLTHYGPGRYAGGTGTEIGLSDLAMPLLAEMSRLGMPLDLTHCSDPAFWQAIEQFDGPVMASHNNCRTLVPHQRQFTDEQIRALVARGAVIGVALDNWMLVPGWRHGDNNVSISLRDVVKHIDYICQLTGNARHVAIGSDLDGGFGRDGSPHDLDTIADLQKIVSLLEERGYADGDIAAIMHGNWVSLLHRAWCTAAG